MKKAVIIGPESSGTRWMRDLLDKHPAIQAFGTSYPCLMGPDRHYPDLLNCKRPIHDFYGQTFDETSVLVIASRDLTISNSSAAMAGYNNVTPDQFTMGDTLAAIEREINAWPGLICFLSYETLVTWKKHYLSSIFKKLGLDPDKYPWETFSPSDGNRKYFEAIMKQPADD